MGRRELSFLVSLLALSGAGCSVALGIDGDYEDCTCGDGVVCSIEECDDGNTSDADRCSSACVLREVVEVTAGGLHTCARLNDGSVKCWGSNQFGQLGLDDPMLQLGDYPNEMGSNLTAVTLGEGRTAVRIAAGHQHTCAILDNGDVKCWGWNVNGQLGMKSDEEKVDLGVDDLGVEKRAVAIGAGGSHTCAILNDDNLVCWGRNDEGQTGAGGTQLSEEPRTVELGAGKTAVAISLGAAHTCALLNDGTVKCWGRNGSGQLGLGNTEDQLTPPDDPVDFGAMRTASALAAGYNHTCAKLSDKSLSCWGNNGWGRLGLGDTMPQSSPTGPVILENGMEADAIEASDGHTCARRGDGFVQCWGYGAYGQVGVGGAEHHSPAERVNLGEKKTAVAIASGQYHNCAILSEGSLKCWGHNDYGQLGLGDVAKRGGQPNQMGDNLPTVKLFSDVW